MNHKPLRVGIIGGSVNNGWARNTHIPAVRQLPELELTAVSTSRMDSAEISAREFQASHAFASAEALSQHPEVDMVVASVKVAEHLEAVKAAVSAGKHIYCEWPLGKNTEEAVQMLELAESAMVHHTIGLQARQAPEINYLKALVEEGYAGKILSVNLRVSVEIMGGYGLGSSAYTLDKSAGGNLLSIYGGHSLDALTYILGGFKELSAILENHYKQANIVGTDEWVQKTADDQIMIQGRLVNGAMVSIHIQGGVNQPIGLDLEIFGDKGTLVLQNAKGSIQMGPYQLMGAKLAEGQRKTPLEELRVPHAYYWIPEALKSEQGPLINVAQAHSKFARDIHEGTYQMPTFADAVNIHRLLDVVMKAAESGQMQSAEFL